MPPRMLAVAPVKKIAPLPRASIRRAGEEAGVTGHFPDLAEYALGRLGDGKIHVGADVEHAHLERRVRVGIAQEGGDVVFFARVERIRDDPATRAFDRRY